VTFKVFFVLLFRASGLGAVYQHRLDFFYSRRFLKFLLVTGTALIGLSKRIEGLVGHTDGLMGLRESARLLVKLIDQFLVEHFLLV